MRREAMNCMTTTPRTHDYAYKGFRSGLEIHQQLDTNKLFCNCPSLVRGTKSDFSLRRQLRAAAGETGKIDIAAQHEMQKKKTFIYTGDRATVCLVELDEEPPQPVNREALDIALQVALMLHTHIVDEIQVMRKTIVDGSNVSGFQRTMLIARNGYIESSKGRISIPAICLEEEAAQKLEENEREVQYSLDRLGVPLLEISTGSELRDPLHVQEVAETIGMILRSTGRVKRGIGSIRQDVNISIKGHPRVEIKGFQELRTMPQIIEGEIARQQKEIAAHKDKDLAPEVRKANADGTTTFLRPIPGASRMYPETDVPPIVPDTEHITLPKLIKTHAEDIQKLGIGEDLAAFVAKEGKAELLIAWSAQFKNIKPAFIAETMTATLTELRREGCAIEKIGHKEIETILNYLNREEIGKDAVLPLLKACAEGKNIEKEKDTYALLSQHELEKMIKNIVQKNTGVPAHALIGVVMKELRGKAEGKKIVALVQRFASQVSHNK